MGCRVRGASEPPPDAEAGAGAGPTLMKCIMDVEAAARHMEEEQKGKSG